MSSRLNESDYRDSLAFLRCLLTADEEGLRAVTHNSDPARVIGGISILALALRIDSSDPLAWIDEMFGLIGDIVLATEARLRREQQDDSEGFDMD